MSDKRYRIELSYSSIDRLFYVRLYDHGLEIKEKSFVDKNDAQELYNRVKG